MVFILRLVHFLIITLVFGTILVSYFLVRKERAKETEKCKNLKLVIPHMAKEYTLPKSDGREFIIPNKLSEFESLEKETKKLPHVCGLCLYRFREE